MKLNGSWQRALIGLLVVLMAMPAPVFAQSNIPVFRQEELDQILAPIALYPDLPSCPDPHGIHLPD